MAVTNAVYGTLQVPDLLRVGNTNVFDFGVANIYNAIQLYLDAYNYELGEQMEPFVQRTAERFKGSSAPAGMKMIMVEEYGNPNVQKVTGVTGFGLPLNRGRIDRQWTLDFLRNARPSELAAQTISATIGDRQAMQTSIRNAIFGPTNYNFRDMFVDNVILPIKAFANGDGYPIPPSPTGATFNAATHTHYMATAGSTLVAADVDSLILNVAEHYNGGRLILYVSRDVEATMLAGRQGSTPTFPLYAPMVNVNTIAPTNAGLYAEGELERSRGTDRQTGLYRDAEVWVQAWMPAGTLFCFMAAGDKPLAMRVPAVVGDNPYEFRPAGSGDSVTGDFGIVFQDMQIPLHIESMARMWGMGVQNRIAGAVMSVNTGGTYAKPGNL